MSLKMKESKKQMTAPDLKTAEMRTHIDHNSIYNLTTSARLTENDIIVETGNWNQHVYKHDKWYNTFAKL